jgi:hypothetical protein
MLSRNPNYAYELRKSGLSLTYSSSDSGPGPPACKSPTTIREGLNGARNKIPEWPDVPLFVSCYWHGQGLSTYGAIMSENRYGWETRLGLTAPARHVTRRGGHQGPRRAMARCIGRCSRESCLP